MSFTYLIRAYVRSLFSGTTCFGFSAKSVVLTFTFLCSSCSTAVLSVSLALQLLDWKNLISIMVFILLTITICVNFLISLSVRCSRRLYYKNIAKAGLVFGTLYILVQITTFFLLLLIITGVVGNMVFENSGVAIAMAILYFLLSIISQCILTVFVCRSINEYTYELQHPPRPPKLPYLSTNDIQKNNNA